MKIMTLFYIGSLSLLLAACGQEPPEPKKLPPPLVKTTVIEKRDLSGIRTFPGKVVAHDTAQMSFRIPGKLKSLPIVEGQRVKKGELIAAIDEKDYVNDVNEKKAQYEKSLLDLSRAARLVKTGAIAQAKYDQAFTNRNVARAQLDYAQKNLADTRLLSPYDGLIADKFIDNFQTVAVNQKIATVHDLSKIDIEIQVPEQDLIATKSIHHMRGNNRNINAAVTFPSLVKEKFKVDLREFSSKADEVTHTYKITFTMKSPENVNLLPGMTASVAISNVRFRKATYDIPMSAIAYDANKKPYVWVVGKDNKVTKRPIELTPLQEGHVGVKSGLDGGERIVTAGIAMLQEGGSVRIRDEDK